VVGVRLVRWRWVVLAASVLLIAAGAAWRIEAMLYLPMFLLGVLMAASLPELLRVRERMPRAGAVVLTVLAPVLLVAPWLLGPSVDLGAVGRAVLETAAVIGAALMVFCAITVPFVQRALETPVLRWLGLISFSLYLVHEPVVIGFAFLLGDDLLPLAALLSVGVSVPLAWLFHRAIEVPSHRLARVVGSKLRARTSERAATTG
jgi:peptidoglycan/LPS O-acetylase OafA/YrhL